MGVQMGLTDVKFSCSNIESCSSRLGKTKVTWFLGKL